MARRREVFAGMTARELRGALLELQGMRLAADAMREQLEEIRQALYRRIDYNLAWLLQEGAHAHAHANNVREAPSQQSSRSQHKTERECDRWQIATLRKIIAFASPEGTDLEAHEYDVARWAEHPNTLGHLEAQERLFAARATQVRREFFGPRARCPLCGETPQQDSSGYAWPEGLSRHLEGRGNVGRCSVIDFAFTECRRARRQAWTTRDKEVGPATCHPDVPSYEYGEGECRSCHEAAWKSWHESIDGEVREWRRRLCEQSSHSWSPDECVRCDATRCRAHYFDGQRCRHAVPCKDHPLPPPVSLEEHRRRGQD
jgi:hypothetical protein